MNNIKNDIELKGIKLENAVQKIIENYANAVFIVDGDVLRRTIHFYPNKDKAKFIYFTDNMAVGSASADILSDDFIALRAEILNNLHCYSVENYKKGCDELKGVSEYKNAEIILLQFDCYMSQIWQLTMQAYMEQLEITEHIKRLCIDYSSFRINSVDNIDIDGSHNAYCNLLCRHKYINSERYLIETEAVECYLDINSTNGELRNYIRNVSSQFENPFKACGKFFHDFPKWGLGESEFFKIAVETFSQDEKYVDIMKKWKRIL